MYLLFKLIITSFKRFVLFCEVLVINNNQNEYDLVRFTFLDDLDSLSDAKNIAYGEIEKITEDTDNCHDNVIKPLESLYILLSHNLYTIYIN